MRITDLNATIEYDSLIKMYRVTLTDFPIVDERGQIHNHTLYVTPDEIPTKFADQFPIFQVGDVIDRVYHKDDGHYYGEGFREFYGRITEIEVRKHSRLSPKRVYYYTDIWTKKRSNGIPQHGIELSINPHID